MDWAQAEAIADLIDASSKAAAKSAMLSLQGVFSKAIQLLNEKIIHLRMYIEAAIDFTDEEINFLNDDTIKIQLVTILHELADIQIKAKQGSFLREGLNIVIAGEPNVGKSSLLNILSGKEVAIVTDIPGTTRDVLRDQILIDGIPVHIIDTAGLRTSADIVEQEGIRRAYHEIEKADMVLYVFEASKERVIDYAHLSTKFPACPLIFIQNKVDLINKLPGIDKQDHYTIIALSAKLDQGIELLKEEIKKRIGFESDAEGIYLARRRHLEALTKAHQYLSTCLNQWLTNHASELMAEDLRLAHLALSEITGEFSAEDLLGKIFSSFCIGK